MVKLLTLSVLAYQNLKMETTVLNPVVVVPVPTVYRNKQKSNSIMIELQKQREQGTFCDVLLEAGGLQYWAHSCVLAAHSKKLGSAVENGKAKFGAKGVIKMKLPTSNALLVESLIKYMYDAHLSITSENVEDMLQLASKLEMDDIKQCCAIHLCRTMTSNNWAFVKKTGEKYKLDDAKRGIREYCAKNFCDIVHDFDFLSFDLDALEGILQGANENGIQRVELHCLYGILKWTCHDLVERKAHYEKLVNMLNPKLLNAEKCMALFEEPTIKNCNIVSDPVSVELLNRISKAIEEKAAAAAERQRIDEAMFNDLSDDEFDYEPKRKRRRARPAKTPQAVKSKSIPESAGKAVENAIKESDIYKSTKSSVRTMKECPFCKTYSTVKNDRLINHIKKSHSDVTLEQMQEELKKILSKNAEGSSVNNETAEGSSVNNETAEGSSLNNGTAEGSSLNNGTAEGSSGNSETS